MSEALPQTVIEKIISEHALISTMITKNHVRTILQCLKSAHENNVPGDVVEFGCNIGTASLFIQRYLTEIKSEKIFHVYDSFEGLPKESDHDIPAEKEPIYKKGMLSSSESNFISNFERAGVKLPEINRCWFSEIPENKLPEKISFAFFDGDFYSSIVDSFEKTYSRLSKGAVVCVHDYSWSVLPGVKKACEDFLIDKPEKGTIKN